MLTGVREARSRPRTCTCAWTPLSSSTTLALAAGPRAAVLTGEEVLGQDALISSLPVLQPLVLARSTRQALRKQRGLLEEVREAVVSTIPGEPELPAPDTSLERLTVRKLFIVVGGAVAAYLLLTQLSNVDLWGLVRRADKTWVAVTLVCSALTYVGAAFSLTGFVLERVPFVRALLAQVASSFVSLVAPPAVGSPALNTRFLQRQGLAAPVALATIGVWQAMSFGVHIVLLVTVGVLAGTHAHTSFDPPAGAVVGAVVVLLVVAGLMSLPWIRRNVLGRAANLGREVLPRLLAVAQRPWKLAEGISGAVFLNVAYCAASSRRSKPSAVDCRGRRSPSSTWRAVRSVRRRRRRADSGVRPHWQRVSQQQA